VVRIYRSVTIDFDFLRYHLEEQALDVPVLVIVTCFAANSFTPHVSFHLAAFLHLAGAE
jgi:hypothetical protein